jgi:hypothetical protein
MAPTVSIEEIGPESAKRVGHPAPFPVALASRVIELYSYVGDVVLDPFCGSGTTCVAAQQLGRRWVGYEVDGGIASWRGGGWGRGRHVAHNAKLSCQAVLARRLRKQTT